MHAAASGGWVNYDPSLLDHQLDCRRPARASSAMKTAKVLAFVLLCMACAAIAIFMGSLPR